jgi:hypothetical protein
MIENPHVNSPKSTRASAGPEPQTTAALVDHLAERPWALAFTSFAVTAILIQTVGLGLV